MYRSDREFLLAVGVEPYEPELFVGERSFKKRDALIRAIAIFQFIAIGAALLWAYF
jgi:hypothetical protein